MFSKRVNIFMGHYGSGKTFISVNFAEVLKVLGKSVAVYDLDIVNPYFRTVDARKRLLDKGIELIASSFARSKAIRLPCSLVTLSGTTYVYIPVSFFTF